MPTRKPKRHSTLGTIRANRGRFAAWYTHDGTTHRPGRTFSTFALADGWLRDEQRLIDRGEWTPPAVRRAQAQAEAKRDELTFGRYATAWVAERQTKGRPLKARTAADYRSLLAAPQWLGALADLPLADLTRTDMSAWYQGLDATKRTRRAHAYALTRSILASAVRDGLLPSNPLDIPGAGSRPSRAKPDLPTDEQVTALIAAMPDRHRLLVLLAATCGLRFGELCALRRSDFATVTRDDGSTGMVIRVRRGIVSVGTSRQPETPKTAAGIRDVPVPDYVVPEIRAHLKTFAQWGRDGLAFPSTNPKADYLTHSQFHGTPPGRKSATGTGFYGALHAVGLDGMHFHMLRHYCLTRAAQNGATLAELKALAGHSDVTAALIYQHSSTSRLATLAEAMPRLTPITKAE